MLRHVHSAVSGTQETKFHHDYAKVHDQTVADAYFAAMERVDKRLEIVSKQEEKKDEVVNVQEQVSQLIQKLEMPELYFEERLGIACQLRDMLGAAEADDLAHYNSTPNKVPNSYLLPYNKM